METNFDATKSCCREHYFASLFSRFYCSRPRSFISLRLVLYKALRPCLHESGHFCNRLIFIWTRVDAALNLSGILDVRFTEVSVLQKCPLPERASTVYFPPLKKKTACWCQRDQISVRMSLQEWTKCVFSAYSRLSLNGHLYKTDTQVKGTSRVSPCLSLLPLFDSL